MLSKSILKYIQSLHQKKYRDQHNAFIAEGVKVVKELLSSGQFISKLICAEESFFTENEQLLMHVEPQNKLIVAETELEKISLLHTPNKVLAIFNKKENDEIILKNCLNLMLDNISDPGNMGTIIRLADWFGIKNIICSEDCVEQYNPKVVQSSMGSLARANIFYTDLKNFINDNKEIDLYAATLTGTSLYSFSKIKEAILLIGNESKGVSAALLSLVKDEITIPHIGDAESLNAAVAAGIILSHLVK